VVRVRGVEREGLKGGCCCFHEYTSYIAQAGGERVHWLIAYKVTLLRQDRIPSLTGPTATTQLCPILFNESADPIDFHDLRNVRVGQCNVRDKLLESSTCTLPKYLNIQGK